MRIKIALKDNVSQAVRREIGPVALAFEIPLFNLSNLQVRYLRIPEHLNVNYTLARWVRYVTHSASYVCRF